MGNDGEGGDWDEQPARSERVVLLLDFCASHGLAITNTMFEHRVVHKCTWYQTTLGQRSLIDVIVSADLRLHILDTQVKRGAELSTDHPLVVSWMRWPGRLPDRRGKPKRVVRVNWEHLVEAPVREVFNSHLHTKFRRTASQGRLGTWNPSGPCSEPPLCSSELWSKGCPCLSWRQPKNPLLDTSCVGSRQAEEGGLSGLVGPGVS